MSHIQGQIKKNYLDVQPDEFPILCETCLGETPYLRMTVEAHGKACKICDRPFTVFRWKPGPKARYKKTELCHSCAKIKNVCQTCVLDLQYGLPVQVRDSALEEVDRRAMPVNEMNREFLLENEERLMGASGADSAYGKIKKPSAMLDRLSKRTPYYKRNLPHVCSFFAKGTCNRGKLCPYRHEMPVDGPLAHQNIRDRYYGQNDPVAQKMMGRARSSQGVLEPPADRTITTLWVGGVEPAMSESALRSKFAAHGEVAEVRVISDKKCAFVTMKRRGECETAAAALFNTLALDGVNLKVAWGRKMAAGRGRAPPGVRGAPPGVAKGPAPPGVKLKGAAASYPSMDPSNMQARFTTET